MPEAECGTEACRQAVEFDRRMLNYIQCFNENLREVVELNEDAKGRLQNKIRFFEKIVVRMDALMKAEFKRFEDEVHRERQYTKLAYEQVEYLRQQSMTYAQSEDEKVATMILDLKRKHDMVEK